MTRAKPPERRLRRNSPTLTVVGPDPAAVVIPAAPEGLLPETSDAWRTYWASQLAQALTLPTDLPALRRLFRYYDDLERSWAIYAAAPQVEGSQGQIRISHFAKHIAEIEPHIRALEDRFGLSPKARLELGVTFGDAARSLEDLYRDATDASSLPAELFVPTAPVRVAARRR